MAKYVPYVLFALFVVVLVGGSSYVSQKPLKAALKQAQRQQMLLDDSWGQKEVAYKMALNKSTIEMAQLKAELQSIKDRIRVLKQKREEVNRHVPVSNDTELYSRFNALGYSPEPCVCK